MPGATFTILTQFGISNGPTYTGSRVVLPPAAGNAPDGFDKRCNTGINTTCWTGNTSYTDLQPSSNLGGGFGFAVSTLALNSNVNTPSVIIDLKNGTNTIISYTLASGQSFADYTTTNWPATAGIATNSLTSIVVRGDVLSDVEVYCILNSNN